MKSLLLSAGLMLSAILAQAGPYLNVSANQLADFYYVVNQGPSRAQAVQLQSGLLGSATETGAISVAASSHFEVSLNNASFSATVSIPFTGDTLGTTNVYVRLKSGQAPAYYKTESLTITSAQAFFGPKSVTLIGFIAAAPVVASSGAVSANGANLSWNAGSVSVDDWQYVLDQSLNAPMGGGTTSSAASFSASGLNPSTTYYFHVRSRLDVWFSDWTTISFTTSSPANVPGTTPGTSLAIVPNPNNGSFRIEGVLGSSTRQPVQVRVLNVTGQTVWSGRTTPDAGKIRVDIATPLPAGIYTVQVENGSSTQNLSLRVAN